MKYLTPFVFVFAITISAFSSDKDCCCSIGRKNISPKDKMLYDSLLNTNSYIGHRKINFLSDSMQISDTAKIKSVPGDSGAAYYAEYLQFSGSFRNFAKYILMIDKSMDSIVLCKSKVTIYASNKCDFCDSGFFSGTQYLSSQFYYYKYHDLYGSFFKYKNIDAVQIFVDLQNKTYLPIVSDLTVFAPNKTMKRQWYLSNTDYGHFFPDDFPSNLGGTVTVDVKTSDYIWNESEADKAIKRARHK